MRPKRGLRGLCKLHIQVSFQLQAAEKLFAADCRFGIHGHLDTKPNRKVLLLVNPIGGKGKARSSVDTVVLPILQAAGCDVDTLGRCFYFEVKTAWEKAN